MIKNPVHEIEAEEFMSKIRQTVTDRRITGLDSQRANLRHKNTSSSYFNWHQLDANIDIAEYHADVHNKVFSFLRFHRLIRWMIRLASRVILYLSKVVTITQIRFNRSVLQTLRLLRNGTRDFEEISNARYSEQQKRIDQLVVELNELVVELNEKDNEKDKKISHLEKIISYTRINMLQQEIRLNDLLNDGGRYKPDQSYSGILDSPAEDADRFLEPLFISLYNEFRGTREEIKEQQKTYLPLLEEAGAGTKDRPVLDIGCGRYEWLELLRDHGFIARGIEKKRLLVEQGSAQGFDVIEADGIEYLKTVKDASIGGVTAFHIIEHLEFNLLVRLLDETVRVLKSGGFVILETPNPANVLVGSCHFYLDPTHRNPLPSQLLKFLAEHRGFSNVKTLELHPSSEEINNIDSELTKKFNRHFYGPRDYAIIGYKLQLV